MIQTLVDTDILIDISNDDNTAKQRVMQESEVSTLAVSVITVMELMVGCRNKAELRELERFVERFQVIHLTEPISARAQELLQRYVLSHGLLIPDALIAATAMEAQMALLSKNQRDFRFIDNLNLLTYP